MLRCAFTLLLLWACGISVFGQNRPSFCDQTPDSLLGGLQTPYTQKAGVTGKPYCEGLLVKPIGLLPPHIISVKQSQKESFVFVAGKVESLNWCDDSALPASISLRSVKIPLFGLDGQESGSFKWHTDTISVWQPSWDNLAATATRDLDIAGHKYSVVMPLRIGTGYSSDYSFMLRSQTNLSLSKVLIQSVESPAEPQLLDISLSAGPTTGTWVVSVPFAPFKTGVYRVTFEESADEAGLTTTPIYILHKTCVTRGKS
jgi:hypothetical protein